MSDLRKLLDATTPGPWVQDGRNQRRINAGSGYGAKVAQASVFADWKPVEEKRDAYQTCESNARLIALAPDLAAALLKAEEALERIAKLGNGDSYGNSDGNMIARVTLTEIRKLTGGK